ncbi:Uncharacterized protein Rs2_46413 [Raphanus sativus]|nr:Uncharacterized protein Rs2_46413 [Raphanus sativus]
MEASVALSTPALLREVKVPSASPPPVLVAGEWRLLQSGSVGFSLVLVWFRVRSEVSRSSVRRVDEVGGSETVQSEARRVCALTNRRLGSYSGGFLAAVSVLVRDGDEICSDGVDTPTCHAICLLDARVEITRSTFGFGCWAMGLYLCLCSLPVGLKDGFMYWALSLCL